MHSITILGDGGLGQAVAAHARERGLTVQVLGRPIGGRHLPAALAGSDLVVEASRGDAVATNLASALDAGVRDLVIATTGWTADRPLVEGLLAGHDAAAVAASNFSLGVALSGRIVGGHPRLTGEDDLEVVSIRAGASPGMHLVGFDAVGETVELRLTARDRSAYATGILAAADWLDRTRRPAGLHAFDPIVDELLARPAI